MSWQFILTVVLALMQMFHLNVGIHAQLVEEQQQLQQLQQQLQQQPTAIQPEVNASIGHLAPSIATTTTPLTHPFEQNTNRRSHHPYNHRHDDHRQHPHHRRPQHYHHWHNGQRVHRVYPHENGQRRYNHNSRYGGRWSTRRRHHHGHYVQWSPWSSCSPDCIKRRERLCRAKRKCGHTKHIEERKCWRCHPATDDSKWSTTSHSLPPHGVTSTPPNQQYSTNSSPTIVINAAAAAATTPNGVTHSTSSVTHYNPPPTPHPESSTIDINNNKYHSLNIPAVESEELVSQHVIPGYNSDDGDESDFYVIKAKRKRKPHHQSPWLPYSGEDFRYHKESTSKNSDYSVEQDDDALNELGSAMPPSQYSEASSNVRQVMQFNRTSARERQSPHHHQRKHQQHQRHRHHQQHQRHQNKRKLKGAGIVGNIDDTSEGDVFQYDDFDIEINNHDDGNQYADTSYDESAEYNEHRNLSGYQRERATPDHMVPRHRRIYSKWSRWTKCTPKCTTRRYKKCRVREQCGREVLREIAYCYTEGSFCQQWLQAQVQKSPAYELRPIASRRRDISDPDGTLSNSIVSDFIMNGKGYRGPEYAPMKLKCGIAPIRSNKRNMYNMLKIIGGKAARKGEWPWQVAIFNRFKEAFCGGTMIAPQWVLTAAHCVRKVLYVRLGEHNLDYEDGTELHLKVLKSYKHPSFDKRTVDSDVALLKLPKPVNSTTWIGFSCLPKPYQPLPKNMDCTVIGWGKRRNRDVAGTSVLHQAEVPIIPMDNCRSVYFDYTITKNMFCAGHKRGRIDTCAGDSGGPLMCRDTTKPNHPWTIFGITSFGDGCAKRNKFGIYAKVPNYVDWVWSVINCNGNCKMHQRS